MVGKWLGKRNLIFQKNELSRLVLDNGIKLDGKKIKGVRSYSVKQNKDEATAELTLFMDVRVI